PDNAFGWSVADLGGDLLVGAPADDTDAERAGAVYLFDGTTGALIRVFHRPAPVPYAQFGLSSPTLRPAPLLPPPSLAVFPSPGRGALRSDAAPGAVPRPFRAPTPAPADAFGAAVAALGSDVLVGGPREAGGFGAVHLFDGATGALVRTFPAPPSTGQFGTSL